jgi:hypothetical protein
MQYKKFSCLTDDYNDILFYGNDANKKNLKQTSSSRMVNKISTDTLHVSASKIYKIHIVIHVIYNRSEENIQNDQIYSQIDILNNDFRNRNLHLIPVNYKNERELADDARIEFDIGTQDLNGNITERIIRKPTKIESFEFFDEGRHVPLDRQPIKSSKRGGDDALEPKKYINVWIGRLKDGKGYAQYPVEKPTEEEWLTDGIVIDYRAFGSGRTAIKPTNCGRTLTHEIGHYLGLYHVWGPDRNGDCISSDEIIDTPPQSNRQSGCPSSHSEELRCGGEDLPLLMNFMDDFDDECSLMFTRGQVEHMHNCLNSLRRHIIN